MTTTLWNIPICINLMARKGKQVPSDHAPVAIDIDSPGHPFDAGWTSADSRIAAGLRK
jgi:exodeoxyribonuclease-3